MDVRWIFGHAAVLAAVGLALGAAAGWIGVARADGADAVSAAIAPIAYALVGLAPIVLVARIRQGAGDAELAATFARPAPLVGVLLVSAVVGAVGACALFLVATTQIPAIFGGEDAELMMTANRAAFGWSKLAAVVGATAVVVLPAVALARR